jgi:hypothetical protein
VGSYTNTKIKRRDLELRFISFWEWDPKDTRAVIEKSMKKSHMKVILEPHIIGGQHKGITVYETDSMDELTDFITYYSPELKMKIYPLTPTVDTSKKWLEHHK